MASESTENRTLSVTLPVELDEWLAEKATELDVDRETVLSQLIASYRAAGELDDQLPVADERAVANAVESELEEQLDTDIESAVKSILAETLDERVEQAVTEQFQASLEGVVSEQIAEATENLEQRLGSRIDGLENDYTQKLEDVRERVIQVKRETDRKAPKEHSHEQIDRIPDLIERLVELETAVDALEETLEEVDDAMAEREETIDDLEERTEEVEDRLQTIAWVVNDLRDVFETGEGEALDRIKQTAAKENIDRAKCENCENGVSVALLTDPECPHCEATVTNVEPSTGFFGKPKLIVASQLESGERR